MKWMITLLACSIVLGGALASGQATLSPTDAQSRRAQLAKLAPQFEELYDNITQTLRTVDRQRFDPQTVIEEVSRNPDKLFAWVRDNTRLVPYRGALRGPVGVLMDRRGNSLDRSLLLAELLWGTGCEVRLANAKLEGEQARKLLDAALSSKVEGVPAPDSQQVRDARERVDKQTGQILKLLGPTPDQAAIRARWTDALADHWWVQRKREGQWVDADLDAPTQLPHPVRTIPYAPQGQKLSLQPADCQEIELRVVIEAFKGGRLQTEAVLKQTFRPAENIGRTINLTHALGEPIKDQGQGNDPAARQRLNSELLRRELFVPTLDIDGRPVTDASFTIAGEVDHNPSPDPTGKLSSAAGKQMGGMFGSMTGSDASKPNGVLTAEWLEYELRLPGRKPQVVRREVFDLLGPTARTAGVKQPPALSDAQRLTRARMLLGQTQILIQPCAFGAEFVTCAFAQRDLREKDVWLRIVGGQTDTPDKWHRAMTSLCARDQTTPFVALLRDGLADPSAFIDSPNIIHHRQFMSEGAGGQLVLTSAIDLAVTSTDALVAESFPARLRQGVADTTAEQSSLGSHASADGNMAGIFDISLAKSAAPVVVRKGRGAAELARLSLPPDVASRASADLAAGNTLVIAGNGGGRWGWWRIDPATGQTVGVIDTGFNAATVEKSKLERWVTEKAELWGQDFTADSLEEAKLHEIKAWGNNIPARVNLLLKWQSMLREITINAIRAGSAAG
jgi:hypothetical protein